MPITRAEAEQIAEKWVADSSTPDLPLTPDVHEFDLGYVVSGRQSAGAPPALGASRGIIDRETGELSTWPSLPVRLVIEQFRNRRAERPAAPRTQDPAEVLRRDLRRVATPGTVTHLSLAGGTLTARGVKGDREPDHHRLVREFFTDVLTPDFRERGYDRSSEAAVLSDALHAEDARRAATGEGPITLDEARSDLFAGARIVTYRVWEQGDPVAGESAPPSIPSALLGKHLGFQLLPPGGPTGGPPGGSPGGPPGG